MLEKAVKMGGSDIFFIPGAPVEVKVHNDMVPLTDERLMPDSSKELIRLFLRDRQCQPFPLQRLPPARYRSGDLPYHQL